MSDSSADSKKLVVKPAVPADAEQVAACVTTAYQHYIARMGKPPGPMLDDYSKVIAQHHVFVIRDPRIIGVVVLIEKPDGILLDNVAVDPGQQGRGIGRQLMTFAEAEALRLGYEYLDLYTHERMVENIAMYAKLGYSETDRRAERGYQRVYMRKKLS